MPMFYLQTTGRTFIDIKIHEGAKDVEEKEADCWLQAKKDFGYELTPVQEWTLARRSL